MREQQSGIFQKAILLCQYNKFFLFFDGISRATCLWDNHRFEMFFVPGWHILLGWGTR